MRHCQSVPWGTFGLLFDIGLFILPFAMGYSKFSHPSQIPFFVFFDIAQPEPDLTADPEGLNAVDAIADEFVYGVCADLPTPGQILFGEDDLCYVLDDRGRISVVH
jgi:hypothetical protein